MTKSWYFFGAFALVSCGKPNGLSTTVVDLGADGTYALREATLTDVVDLATMRGKVVEFFAAPEFVVNFSQVGDRCFVNGEAECNGDAADLRRALAPHPQRSDAQFASDGRLLRALDFDTLSLATAYVQFSEADTYYRQFGWDPLPLGAAPVWYYPKPQGLLALSFPSSDNAAYFQYIDGFILLPMAAVQGVPLGMNRGVMFHEYHHRVFANRIYGGNIFKTIDLINGDETALQAINRLKAVDEGLADFFGAIGANDPNFLARSIAGRVSAERDLTIPRTFDAAWIDGSQPAASTTLGDIYDPYVPGSVFAHTMWKLRERVGETPTVQAWFNVEDQLHDLIGTDATQFQFVAMLDLLALNFTTEQRVTVCDELRQHFQVLMSQVAACTP